MENDNCYQKALELVIKNGSGQVYWHDGHAYYVPPGAAAEDQAENIYGSYTPYRVEDLVEKGILEDGVKEDAAWLNWFRNR